MEEVSLTDTEVRYYGDLFVCCDEEKTSKIPMLKATELYRSAQLTEDVVQEITSLAGIPATALHISRAQFYSCLKLIAACQAGMPLRQELIAATIQLPLPRFSWRDSPSILDANNQQSQHHISNNLNTIPPPPVSDRRNSLPRRAEWPECTAAPRRNSAVNQGHLEVLSNSDVLSTDSEVEHNDAVGAGGNASSGAGGAEGNSSHETRRRGSPEAWSSTNSDSPTPTNSVAERPWTKTMWGLLGDEHRQLLGTEEESSDRHSSDEDNETDLETIYQITGEQREYYFKQFKAVQRDTNGLLGGQVARVFFEKSRIPVEELRHIWQLCDVTRDGALSLAEFTAAMHLVVLRRNNIPLPTILPACLHPTVLQHRVSDAGLPKEPPEADLLHLNDDDEENIDSSIVAATRVAPANDNIMNMSTLSASSQTSVTSRHGHGAPLASPTLNKSQQQHRSISNSPNVDGNLPSPSSTTNVVNTSAAAAVSNNKNKDCTLWTTEAPSSNWTKFTESPTSNVSSPGPKPVNFDMQRTAQAVVSDPQILHPVPLRVTPVAATGINSTDLTNSDGTAHVSNEPTAAITSHLDISPKQVNQSNVTSTYGINATATAHSSSAGGGNSSGVVLTNHARDSLQSSDLRAIQRPQAKKLPAKNSVLPPPPQRESSIGSVGSGAMGAGESTADMSLNANSSACLNGKKDPPPPPPRPHRHGRSSSLDLNKFKMVAISGQQAEITAQASFDLQTSTGFADFTQFPEGSGPIVNTTGQDNQQQYSQTNLSHNNNSTATTIAGNNAALPPSRISLQCSQNQQRVSAFEVYRKPNTPRNSQSPLATITSSSTGANQILQSQDEHLNHPQPTQPPPPAPFGAGIIEAENFEKRVNAISETLRHVSFQPDANNSMTDVLRHLREQNNLLLRLCNDLSDELLTVQTRKEEMRLKLDPNGGGSGHNQHNLEAASIHNSNSLLCAAATNLQATMRTASSISAPVTANITGGSGSGVQSNV